MPLERVIEFKIELQVGTAPIAKVPYKMPPTPVSEVRSFLGLVGYYQRFIPNFSKVAKLITELLKNGTNYIWNDACDEAFKVLKKLL
jgi:hypothetical protein